MGWKRRTTLARSAGALLRTWPRLALPPLAAVVISTATVIAALAAGRASLETRTRIYGSAYRTAGLGLQGVNTPRSGVTTLRPTLLTGMIAVAAVAVVLVVCTAGAATVVAAVDARLRTGAGRPSGTGDDPSLRLGPALVLALRRAPQLVGWSLLATTVGPVHRVVEKRGLVGALPDHLAGLPWRLASWLAVPVVLADGRGPVRSLRRSARLFADTWGEDVFAHTGLGALGCLLYAPAIILAVAVTPRSPALGLALAGTLAALALAVVSTLNGLLRAALHRHARGEAVPGFDDRVLATAFRPRPGALRRPAPRRRLLHDPTLDATVTLAAIAALPPAAGAPALVAPAATLPRELTGGRRLPAPTLTGRRRSPSTTPPRWSPPMGSPTPARPSTLPRRRPAPGPHRAAPRPPVQPVTTTR